MKLHRKFGFLLFIAIFFSCICSENHVIGSRQAGFFSNFIGVLNHLLLCSHTDKKPIVFWDNTNYYFQPEGYNESQNVWEYYFEPVSEEQILAEDPIDCAYNPYQVCIPKFENYLSKKMRIQMHSMIEQYITLKPAIQKKIDDFYFAYMNGKKTIGVHIRGTDKWQEAVPLQVKAVVKIAKKYRKNYQFLIATDEGQILYEFIDRIKAPVIYYPAHRTWTGEPIHIVKKMQCSPALLGEEILIEAKLLSMCDMFIHGNSNVALGVLFFNPELKHIYLDGSDHKTFWGKIKKFFVNL